MQAVFIELSGGAHFDHALVEGAAETVPQGSSYLRHLRGDVVD